ncbi:hypothetical protein AGMMS49957_01830 [Synergistales bacterium]|nr:hypothetical protein AGMMS49957_01830 [Synergistales bacterium]
MKNPNHELKMAMRARLKEKGLTVEEWAQVKGIGEGVASSIVSRYVGRARRPTGWRAKEIIEGLEELTGIKLCG